MTSPEQSAAPAACESPSAQEYEPSEAEIEQAAAIAHDAYLHECFVQLRPVKPECAPQYANLTEDMKDFDRRMALYVISYITPLILAAERKKVIEECAKVASRFSVKSDASLGDHPWETLKEEVQFVVHAAAQEIAAEIRALAATEG